MADKSASESGLSERLERLERVLGLQTLASDEGGDAGGGNSTASDHCGNSTISNHCIVEDLAARRAA
jgi:hypothetical protein